jgi:hypothetical protein
MSTIINATTTNGVVIQPDNSGSLVLQTNSGTTALTIDTSQRAAFVAGTAALPAITTTGDTNTGIWFPAADTIAFAEGGAEAMRIDSNGNVGIGTASPSAPLTVASSTTLSSGSPSVVLQGESNRERIAIFSAGAGNGTPVFFVASARGTIASPTAVLSGDPLGYYQFGGYDSVGYLRSAWVQGIAAENYSATNRGSHLTFNTTPIASTTIAERMRITAGGEVYIAGTADQGAYNLQCNGTGVWGAGAYVNGSDSRIKDDIQPISSSLEVVNKLNPVTFKYKEDWSKDQSVQTGFIAQELQETLKDEIYIDGLVNTGGEYLSVAYQNIIPLLTKAVQEQQTIINDLKARVETLEGAKLG